MFKLSCLEMLQDICGRPSFIASGAGRFDVELGELGDPWLLAAVSSLTLTPRFLDRVVPPDQSFDLHYCGLFRLTISSYFNPFVGTINCRIVIPFRFRRNLSMLTLLTVS